MYKMLSIVSTYLLCMWLGQSILVDIFLAPKLFQVISNFFLAGTVALTIFKKLNVIELFVSSFIFASTVLLTLKNKKYRFLVIVSLLLVGIVFLYNFYLTDKIQALTDLWQYAEDYKKPFSEIGFDPQQEHQFYHRLYVACDMLKIVLISLSIFLFTSIHLKNDTEAGK